jgi:activating signal cointegrator complex subunit 3
MTELDQLHEACVLPVMGGIENSTGKVNCLIQMYVSRERVDGFSLISDMSYVAQNVVRIARALFEMTMKRGWPIMSGRLLNICKSLEKRLWHFQSPMRQFEGALTYDILQKIEDNKLSIEQMQDLSAKGNLAQHTLATSVGL